MASRTRVSLACIGAYLLAGCATANVKLRHEPASVQAPTKGSVAMTPFVDARSADVAVGRQIGQVRDSDAVPFMKLLTSDSPVLWVEEGLARGLAEAGYRVARVDQPSAAGTLPVIQGSVKEVFADKYFRMEAWLLATVSVERDGNVVFSTDCRGSDTAFAWTDLEEQVEARFKAAMAKLVEDCVPKIAPHLSSSLADAKS